MIISLIACVSQVFLFSFHLLCFVFICFFFFLLILCIVLLSHCFHDEISKSECECAGIISLYSSKYKKRSLDFSFGKSVILNLFCMYDSYIMQGRNVTIFLNEVT